MNEKSDGKKETSPKIPSHNLTESRFKYFNEALSEPDLRIIFQAKCEDFKLAFTESLFQRFLRRQKDLSSPKILHLESCGLGPIAANIIVEAVFRKSTIKILNISDNSLADKGACCLADLIYNSHSLVSVDLGSNHMTDEGTKIIFTALKANKHIVHLSIGGISSIGRNIIGPNAAQEIANCLQENKVISELNFSMTELNSYNAKIISQGLVNNHCLTHLDLSRNNIRSSGAISLFKSLSHSSIVELKLSSNHIGDDVSPNFVVFLTKNPKLRVLDLSANDLGFRFMTSLTNSAISSTVEELILSKNPLGGRGISAFGPYLAQNSSIRILNVNGCQIDCNGFAEFCLNLQRSQSLEVLQVQHNPLTDEGITKLAIALNYCKSLRELDLENVEMTDPGAYKLFRALNQTKISVLSVKNNLIHDGSFVQNQVESNKNLIKLNIEYNDINYKATKEILQIVSANMKKWRKTRDKLKIEELHADVDPNQELKQIRVLISMENDEIREFSKEFTQLQTSYNLIRDKTMKHKNELEERHDKTSNEVSQFIEQCRNGKSDIMTAISKTESEISQLSAKLARDSETCKTQYKAIDNLQNKIEARKVDYQKQEDNLNEQLQFARLKYTDAKESLIAAWTILREQKELAAIAMQENDSTPEIEKPETNRKGKKGKSSKASSSKKRSGKISRKDSPKKSPKGRDTKPNTGTKTAELADSSNQPDDLLITIPGTKVQL